MIKLSSEARNLNWLVSNFVAGVPGVDQAAVVSSDGLLIAMSDGLDRPPPTACRPSRRGCTACQGRATPLNGGTVHEVIVEFEHAILFVMSISDASVSPFRRNDRVTWASSATRWRCWWNGARVRSRRHSLLSCRRRCLGDMVHDPRGSRTAADAAHRAPVRSHARADQRPRRDVRVGSQVRALVALNRLDRERDARGASHRRVVPSTGIGRGDRGTTHDPVGRGPRPGRRPRCRRRGRG